MSAAPPLTYRTSAVALLAVVGFLGCGAVFGITELTSDAPGDGGPLGDGGIDASSWCSAQAPDATFCDDFGGPSLREGWSSVEASGAGGAGTLDKNVFLSAPSAFTARAQSSDKGYAQRCLKKTFVGGPAGVVVGIDARIDVLEADNAASNMTIVNVSFAGTGQEHPYALDVNLQADGLHLLEELSSGTVTDHPLRYTPTKETWMRIELDFHRAAPAAAPTASVKINGQSPVDPIVVSDAKASGSPTVRVGIPYVLGSSAQRFAHVDNVAVYLR